ncbi:hypothetical protein [Aureispira anguillae]|uniref:Uncharacterized protein n=1 Tax=Aureispira anguillae TaxID=2864201 RepID=A0A915YHL6_9BACT|nr:hypothetical protein [Aureispira anguillae]BDS13159.1 hypothetical protein AsAng_0038870 [Aureispira anguillae]
MIVPCNHTVLYTQLMENAFGLNMHQKCSHDTLSTKENHHHHDKTSNHHHSCTPFCACGIVHFILNAPPYQKVIGQTIAKRHPITIFESISWAPNADNYKKLMVNDIWHPPQTV